VQRRSSRRWLFAGVAAAVIVGVGIFFVPAVLQSLQIRDLHAAINKQITTIEQQLTDLKNQQSYPQDLASAETLLQDLQQQSRRIETQISAGEQQHRQALQALEQQKISLEQKLSEHQASLEQQQARFEKASINLEQTQLDIQELTKTVEILKQDDQTLAQSTRKNLDIVNLMVAKLQQDMEPFIAKYQTSPDMENRIAELLGKAESAFRKRNFTTPRSDNVVMWAEEVLKLDTDNAQAKEAISKVIDTYLDWAWLPQAGSLQHYFTAAQEQRFKQLNSRPSSTGNNRPRSSGSRRSEPEEKKGWFEQWFQGNNEN
jgi:DNA repair exonuclease SbcCD ATPase subunit